MLKVSEKSGKRIEHMFLFFIGSQARACYFPPLYPTFSHLTVIIYHLLPHIKRNPRILRTFAAYEDMSLVSDACFPSLPQPLSPTLREQGELEHPDA